MSSVLIAGPKIIETLLTDIAGAVREVSESVVLVHGGVLDQRAELLDELDVVLTVKTPLGAGEFAAMRRLRAAISPIIGYDWIDVAAASARNIVVANGEASENYESMAEATIMLMLVSLYDLKNTERQIREMRPRPTGPMSARMVRGKTIGIIGYGNIARAVIDRLANWDARLLVSTRTPRPDTSAVRFVQLDHLLEQSDVVIVLTALTPENRALLDAGKLGKLKPGCVFINTARGDLVDEAALAKQIASGRIGRAALDVFEQEPLPADSPLRSLENTILTEHIVGHTREMYEAIPRIAAENVLAVMSGVVPKRTRNDEIAQRWLAKWQVSVNPNKVNP